MKKIIFFLFIFCFAISVNVTAQTFPVPVEYSLKTKADFYSHEQDLINTINWLEETPWDSHKEERKLANTFLMTWITESPTITLELNSQTILDIADKNPELLVTFMGGYLKYALQNKDAKDVYDVNKAYTAGVRAMITKYRNEHHVKDRNVDKLARTDQSGRLETWVKNDFYKAN